MKYWQKERGGGGGGGGGGGKKEKKKREKNNKNTTIFNRTRGVTSGIYYLGYTTGNHSKTEETENQNKCHLF